MQEKRKFERINLNEHPIVYDAHSNKLLGTMVDLSAGGFRIMTNCKMEKDQDYLLRIVSPKGNSEGKNIVVKVNVRWCNRDLGSIFFAVGCFLAESDTKARLELSALMLKGLKNTK
jgi:hypothetical protein